MPQVPVGRILNRRRPDANAWWDHANRARAQQSPDSLDIATIALGEMECLGENSLSGQQRQAGSGVGFHTGHVPMVSAVNERQDCAGINQRAGGHISFSRFP